jgi:hypothetical protein
VSGVIVRRHVLSMLTGSSVPARRRKLTAHIESSLVVKQFVDDLLAPGAPWGLRSWGECVAEGVFPDLVAEGEAGCVVEAGVDPGVDAAEPGLGGDVAEVVEGPGDAGQGG